jgi:hypothetical protein
VEGILVVGPESSGTRLLTRCFIAAGCDGDDTHEQRFDQGLPAPERPIVWRRSVPYWGRWPNIGRCLLVVGEAGYRPRAVVITRDWHATTRSQVRAGHARDEGEAEIKMRRAVYDIYRHLLGSNVPFCWITYEGLVQRPRQTLAWLMARHNLPLPEIEIYDGNARYYLDHLMNGNGQKRE